VDPSPALILTFRPGTSAATRDEIVGLLADYSLVAIEEDDPATPRSWTAHFTTATDRDAAAAALTECHPDAVVALERTEIPDDDWARRTQADLPPVSVGRFIVAAPWAASTVDAGGRTLIEIEPSRGFGTGHHQSTRLCLALLQRTPLDGTTVIDIGTGSGILAIAAALLGASHVEGLDEDPDAVENARENAERNGVASRVHLRVADALAKGANARRGDVVTANLTGTLLARYAGAVGAFVAGGGRLIVSGFTIDERDRVLEAFAASFSVIGSADEDGWWAYLLVKRAVPLAEQAASR
jgi:ribosomal protein L11 methyltransferase